MKVYALAVILLFVAVAAGAVTHVVDPSDSLAYATIQAGVNAAGEGDTVSVRPGTYTGDGNRDIDVPETSFSLIGQGGSASVIIDGQNQTNHRAFRLYDHGHDATMVIEGFTIRRFVVTNTLGPGAGIRCEQSESPTLRDLVIEDCQAVATWAAGIYCNQNSSPTINDVVISGCSANNGAALYCASQSNPICTNVAIEGCTVSEHGAVYIALSSSPQFISCTFGLNQSVTDGGAVYMWNSCSPGFANCLFIENSSGTSGGAIQCSTNCFPVIGNCTFVWNMADSGGDAMNFVVGTYPTIYSSIIAFNGEGRGTTVQCDGQSFPTIAHSCLWANTGGDDVCGASPDGSNFIVDDPLFCNIGTLDLTLASNSPCLAANNSWSQDVGALGQGCTQSLTDETSWGTIKSLYR